MDLPVAKFCVGPYDPEDSEVNSVMKGIRLMERQAPSRERGVLGGF